MRTDNLTKMLQLPINAGKKDNQKPSRMKHTFTEVYHNDRPFFIEIMSSNSNRCAACQVEIPWRISKPPFNLVLRHSERWSFKKDGNVINTQKYRNSYYHFSKQCIQKRFPYFESNMLDVTVLQKAYINNTRHKEIIKSEFDHKIS